MDVISTEGRDLKISHSVRNDKVGFLALLEMTDETREDQFQMNRNYYVYILTNWNNKVMYVGVTNNLERRIHEHQSKRVKGFTEKYNINKLVYFEETQDVHAAIGREKEIKKWRREKKDALVKQLNPDWKDLTKDFSLRSK